MEEIKEFSKEIIEELGWYVYSYIDPRTDKIFYIGKGKGNRILEQHNKKTEDKIEEIKEDRKDVIRKILRYDIPTEKMAFEVESAFIDFLKSSNNDLTNEVSGHYSSEVSTIDDFIVEHTSALIPEVKEKIIAIKLTNTYDAIRNIEDENEFKEKLYEITRKSWRISLNRANTSEYVFAVYGGKVREVYKVDIWKEITEDTYKDFGYDESSIGRKFFNGKVASEEIREKYINKNIEMVGQNPIKYINC